MLLRKYNFLLFVFSEKLKWHFHHSINLANTPPPNSPMIQNASLNAHSPLCSQISRPWPTNPTDIHSHGRDHLGLWLHTRNTITTTNQKLYSLWLRNTLYGQRYVDTWWITHLPVCAYWTSHSTFSPLFAVTVTATLLGRFSSRFWNIADLPFSHNSISNIGQ